MMMNDNKKWIELHIDIPLKLQEKFCLWLDDEGCIGTVLKETKADSVLTAYFEENIDIKKLERSLKKFLIMINLEAVYQIGYLKEKDWATFFRKYFQPFEINRELRIVPPWLKVKEQRDIIIKPQMAFGTGRHESTQLCLYFILEKKGRFKNVLDIGTGSGILAITSVRFGAERVVAFDIDREAVRSCVENVKLNKILKKKILVFCGTLDALNKKFFLRKGKRFDLVLCNMLPDKFFSFLPQVHNYLKRDIGRIILSGIHTSKKEEVEKFLKRKRFKIVQSKVLNDWIAYEIRSEKRAE